MADAHNQQKVAVITGASSGIGYATALAFSRKGYNVVLVARRQRLLREVAAQCEDQGVKTLVVTADVTDEAAVQKVAEATLHTFGHFDIWVNGAAVSLFAKFEEAPLEDFRRVIETNLFGYVHGSRAAIKQFKSQGYGTLINIGSVTAGAPQPYTSAYVASKYAIRGLSESIRMELELENMANTIHVCNVMPASIDTNLFQNAANYTHREVRALEPVYDPTYVAQHIVKLAGHPRREVIVGPAGKVMVAEHAVMRGMYERMASRMIDKNHLGTMGVEDSAGNLYEPIQENTGMRGGWREERVRADRMNITVGAATAFRGAAAGLSYIMFKKRKAAHVR
jgi:short-subunit dehydrogenase